MLIGCTDVVVEIENDEILRDCEIIFKEYDPDFKWPEDPVFGECDYTPPPSPERRKIDEEYRTPSPPPPPLHDEDWLQVLEVLELPTILSERHQLSLSDTVVLVREGSHCTKVFALDLRDCQLYFVLAKEPRLKRELGIQTGYVALGDNLYFLGSGELIDDDLTNTDPVDVHAYNLNTRQWDKENTTKLNCTKPSPLVFVYHRKIYALEGPICDPLLEEHASFECLDPATSSWTRLQSLPIRLRDSCKGILHAQKGTFFLHYDAEFTLQFAFDLTSGQWTRIFPEDLKLYPVAQLLLRIPQFTIEGACIVENFLFTYETGEWGEPLIVYYDLDDINLKGEKIDLSPVLDQGYRNICVMSTVGYLNYLGYDRFSLVINALAGGASSSVCCCTIELRKVPGTKQYPRVSKEPRLQKFNFRPTLICCRAYQMPRDVLLRFCQKIQ